MLYAENATIVKREEKPLLTYEEVLHDIRRYQIALRFAHRQLSDACQTDERLVESFNVTKDALDHSIAKYGDLMAEKAEPALTSEKQITL
jgi:hypothetical protein